MPTCRHLVHPQYISEENFATRYIRRAGTFWLLVTASLAAQGHGSQDCLDGVARNFCERNFVIYGIAGTGTPSTAVWAWDMSYTQTPDSDAPDDPELIGGLPHWMRVFRENKKPLKLADFHGQGAREKMII